MVFLKSSVFGTAVWYGAALFIQQSGLFENDAPLSTQAILYVAAVPTSMLLVNGLKLIGIRNNEIPKAAAIATGVATLLDGLALIWLPGLYGARLGVLSNSKGAAFLLWGVGCGLLFSQA